MTNEQLMKAAEEAIDAVFSDDSVDLDTALENMEELRSEIDSKIDCLNDDIKNRDEG